MKNIFLAMEDLWVAVAFAEAGEYHSLLPVTQPFCKAVARLNAV
jgi:hypothetical protein